MNKILTTLFFTTLFTLPALANTAQNLYSEWR